MFRAWRNSPAGLTESSLSVPELDGDQILVAVEAASVSRADVLGSDTHAAGGSAVGTVVQAAEGATHLQGKRVAVGPVMPCGECDVCRRGAAAVCPGRVVLGQTANGAVAERVVARARWVCPLEDELTIPGPAAALIGRELADAYAMFATTGIAPGEPVVIVGDNVVARLLASVAVAKGVEPLFVSATEASWLEESRAVRVAVDAGASGASHVATRAAVAEAADRAGHGARPWRVLETGGTAASRALAASLAGPGSSITFGPLEPMPLAEVEISGFALTSRGCRVVTVPAAHPDLIPEAAALAVRGDVDLDACCQVISPEELGRAAELMAQAPQRGLVVRF